MFSRFFIHRPVFAAVLSIVIVVAGLVTFRSLPVAQYPEIAPPVIHVAASFPGADAATVARTVAQPVEEQVNGVEDMLYMASTCSNSGEYLLDVSFKVGTDMDMAQTLVQNRVAQAAPLLPEEVQRIGVTVTKQSTSVLLFAVFTSTDPAHDDLFLSNYAVLNVKDELMRVDGVGSIVVYGAGRYSMRVWLAPDRLKALGLAAADVVAAIREQNVQVAAGQIGQPPMPGGGDFQLAITTQGRLRDVAQFEDIVVKTSPSGGMVRIRDVARVELGAQSYDQICMLDGRPAGGLAVFLQPGANALEVAEGVKARLAALEAAFPEGVECSVPFDTTTFVDISIHEVYETLFIAALLVFLVTYVFLQDWRATLIPAATIPVSLIGTFAVMAALGVGINMLSLFGIVLAIGIVVDDAIIVVENTVRNIDELALTPTSASIKAMDEVTGPIVATTLVLLAVFLPTALVGGVTGQLYRQFALTVAVATVFSALNALTLSPALGALLLRKSPPRRTLFARWFDRGFERTRGAYLDLLAWLLRRGALGLLLFAGLCGVVFWQYGTVPKGFVPMEDQGYAVVPFQLPDAASLERTRAVMEDVNARLAGIPGVCNTFGLGGFSVMDHTSASNAGVIWTIFEPWDKRAREGLGQDVILGRVRQAVSGIREARIFAFPPPAIFGLGQAGGFSMEIQDRSNAGLGALQTAVDGMARTGNAQPELGHVYSMFRTNIPQLRVDIDRVQAKSMNIPLSSIFTELQANFGSLYVNDFNQFGRSYQVRVQADAPYRDRPEAIVACDVRGGDGGLVPLGALASVRETVGPQIITRYNMYPAALLKGQGMGISSAEAMDLMERVAETTLPAGLGYEWTDISFQERVAAGQGAVLFVLAIAFVYLVLCAQYESWTVPLSVVLSVPLALLGCLGAVRLCGLEMNVYTQLGVILLIALTCKTAILISEFAKNVGEGGLDWREATLQAAQLRFRPILMTAFALILGVFPLVVATGAGAASRRALGTAVFGGLLSATALLVFFVPLFFLLVMRGVQRLRGTQRSHDGRDAEPGA
jgi:HAE1 family hydrophobic/amphiphilic exporter-1